MSSSAPVARILLVRHGQSTWNADGRWQGTEDPPLSTLGVRQARIAADVLGTFDVIATSPLQRALTTATTIAEASGTGPVLVEADLAERHAGGFQGLTRAEIRERYPGYLDQGRVPPGWEPDEEVSTRSSGALARIAGMVGGGGTALVVTHGGVISCLERLLSVPRTGRIANLGGRWFDVGPGTLRAGVEVLLIDAADATVPDQI